MSPWKSAMWRWCSCRFIVWSSECRLLKSCSRCLRASGGLDRQAHTAEEKGAQSDFYVLFGLPSVVDSWWTSRSKKILNETMEHSINNILKAISTRNILFYKFRFNITFDTFTQYKNYMTETVEVSKVVGKYYQIKNLIWQFEPQH